MKSLFCSERKDKYDVNQCKRNKITRSEHFIVVELFVYSEFHGIQNAQSLALFDHPGIWHVDSVTILGGDARY